MSTINYLEFHLNLTHNLLISSCLQVMDNFLIQVTGKKRIILFSPRDAQFLYLTGTVLLGVVIGYSFIHIEIPFRTYLSQ